MYREAGRRGGERILVLQPHLRVWGAYERPVVAAVVAGACLRALATPPHRPNPVELDRVRGQRQHQRHQAADFRNAPGSQRRRSQRRRVSALFEGGGLFFSSASGAGSGTSWGLSTGA
jgi:hypothetical protein